MRQKYVVKNPMTMDEIKSVIEGEEGMQVVIDTNMFRFI